MEQLLQNGLTTGLTTGLTKKMSQGARTAAHLFAIVKPQKTVDHIAKRLREECRYIQQQRQASQSLQ